MLVQQIDINVVIAIIGLLGAVIPVGFSYLQSKNKEVDASIQQQKTDRYDGLIRAIEMMFRDIVEIETGRAPTYKGDTINNFITAYYKASTYASDLVLKSCNDLIMEIKQREGSDIKELKDQIDFEGVQGLILDIYKAIRLDINSKAKYSMVQVLWPVEDEVKPPNEPDNQK